MRKGFLRTLAFTLVATSIMASAIPACAMSESTGSAVESSVSVAAEQTKTDLEKSIKNIDPSDVRTFPTGHYMVNGVQVYSDAYCTALLYYDAPQNAEAYCSGTIIIKDTSVWDKGPLTQIAGTPLKNIIKFCGKYEGEFTYGEVSKIRLYHEECTFYDHHLRVTGGAAKYNRDIYTAKFGMSFMDKTGDIYNLGFSSAALGTDTSRVHDLDYNSDAPDIVRIDWNGLLTKDGCVPGPGHVCTYAY